MRVCVLLLVAGLAQLFAEPPKPETIEGRLAHHGGRPATLELSSHRSIALNGDAPTLSVLDDKRLDGMTVQAKGHFTSAGRFLVDPMHTRALLVRHDGRLKSIAYWCALCSIRAYTPGPCACCQQETALDLRDPGNL